MKCPKCGFEFNNLKINFNKILNLLEKEYVYCRTPATN